MMKTLTLLAIALILFSNAFAQEKTDSTAEEKPVYWTKKASFGVNVTNVGLENWAGGGENSFSVSGLIKAKAEYKKGKMNWLNTFEGGYGVVRQGDITEFRKSDDRIIAISKVSRTFNESNFSYSALFDFRTQFTDGYRYFDDEQNNEQRETISSFLAPGYVNLSIGAAYKPSENLYLMLSPVSGKLTIVADPTLAAAGAFGVDSGSTFRNELGANLSGRWEYEPMENITYETKFNLFQAYREGAALDVIWDNLLDFKVNDYISSTFSTQLIYDEDVDITQEDGTVGPAVQFKHVFTVGFLLKF